jgi:VCBS repeat-containing protein
LATLDPRCQSGGFTFAPNDEAINAMPAGSETVLSFDFQVSAGENADTANYSITLTGENDTPTIGGVNDAQSVNSNATINPFAAVTINDVDTDATGQLSVSFTTGKGSFTSASLIEAGFRAMEGGGYETSQGRTPAELQTAIRQLVFQPAEGAVGNVSFTTTVTDDQSAVAVNGDTLVNIIAVVPTTHLTAASDSKSYATSPTAVNIDARDGNDYVAGSLYNDTLKGGNGSDYLTGNNGHDVLYGEAGVDSLYGDNGNDTLYGGTENDKLYGRADNDLLFGEAGNDLLSGDAGNDILIGGAGTDTLVGGLGADIFVLDEKALTRINDFNVSQGDKIGLDSGIFAGLNLDSAGDFFKTLGTAPIDDSDRILYNKGTGALFYDADGSGTEQAQVQIGLLANYPTLAAGNFEMYPLAA